MFFFETANTTTGTTLSGNMFHNLSNVYTVLL